MEFRGSETHTKFKDIFKTPKEAETSALNYNKANAKSLFFLRFLCFFIYITHEKR